jgi:hypothetical protein
VFRDGSQRLVVDLESIYHVLETDVFRTLDVELARREDVANGAIQRGQRIHRIRRLEQRVGGFRYRKVQPSGDGKVEESYEATSPWVIAPALER